MDFLKVTYRAAKRIVIAIVGGTLLVLGIVMLVAPGPAFIVLPLGLGILALEFAWARSWLRLVREKISAKNATNRAVRAEGHRRDSSEL